jgi:glycosyltransferase involved in cell wall biosynthesis
MQLSEIRRAPGMSEDFCAIQQNRTGLLVPARAEALRGAIELLASDSALSRRLGQNARNRVEREFARERC